MPHPRPAMPSTGHMRSPLVADELEKRKWDSYSSDDDEEPASKRPRISAPPPHNSLCAVSYDMKLHHRPIEPHKTPDLSSGPSPPLAGPGLEVLGATGTVPKQSTSALPPSSADEEAEADDNDDWDDWVFNTRPNTKLESISPEAYDLHWAELERIHQISPVAPATENVPRTPERLDLPAAAIAAEGAEDGLDDNAPSPPATVLSPSVAPQPQSRRETMSPLTEAEDEGAGAVAGPSRTTSSRAARAAARTPATPARPPTFSRLAQHDQFFDFRARNIDGDRIQCGGCGRWMQNRSWEKHLKEICPVYLIQPVLPTPARALLAKAKAQADDQTKSGADEEDEDTKDDVLPTDPEAMRERLASDPRVKDVSSNSAQCAGCNRWIKFPTWKTHSTKTCRTLKKKTNKKYWVYVSEDED